MSEFTREQEIFLAENLEQIERREGLKKLFFGYGHKNVNEMDFIDKVLIRIAYLDRGAMGFRIRRERNLAGFNTFGLIAIFGPKPDDRSELFKLPLSVKDDRVPPENEIRLSFRKILEKFIKADAADEISRNCKIYKVVVPA